MADLGRDAATWLSTSRISSLRAAVADSTLVNGLRSLSARASGAVRSSYLYRWLTKEPEPDVIVIDLRETWSVGPVIAALDHVLAWLGPHWRGSTLKRGVDALGSVGSRAAETRVGRLLASLLAPPEPPDADRNRSDADAEREEP